MNPMKRLGLAMLLVVGVTVLASTPAQAAVVYGPLEFTNTGAEPDATGQATISRVRYSDNGATIGFYSFKASVTCQNLTPGATYSILGAFSTAVGTFTANRKGEGQVTGTAFISDHSGSGDDSWTPFWWYWLSRVVVVRLNADGTRTTVLLYAW